MIRLPPGSTLDRSSAASDVYKRQLHIPADAMVRMDELFGNTRMLVPADLMTDPVIRQRISEEGAGRPAYQIASLMDDVCLLYTSDAADERSSVDLGGRRIIKKKTTSGTREIELCKTTNEQ